MKSIEVDRRTFLAGATTGLSASSLLSADAQAEARPAVPPIRAAVMEFPDRWSEGATGLGELLRRAGCEVTELSLDRSPTKQPILPDLIAIGSFVNNDSAYGKYVGKYADQLRRFVELGGVILEMTQSDQFGKTVPYLPKSMTAERGDRDLDVVLPLVEKHPLVELWFPKGVKQVGSDYFHRERPNWESFERWQNLQVLLASEATGGAPCLLEGAHGKGRFLLCSLWIDKCFKPDGSTAYAAAAIEASQRFFNAVASYVAIVQAGGAPKLVPTPPPALPATGPMVGHVDAHSARIWFRPSQDHQDIRTWRCKLSRGEQEVASAVAEVDADHDFSVLFDIVGLDPATEYLYQIESGAGGAPAIKGHSFRTPPPPDQPSRIVMGLGSCAPSDPNYVWDCVLSEDCAAFVFLGDTPYVDSNELHVAREKHREFLSQPEIARMISRIPCWGTWDDHDFGKNNGHGDFPGKHACRIAFTEYRANATFGHAEDGTPQTRRFGDGKGIYTSFRWGPLEMFLLDPRWFSRTEPSWADPAQPTCLGRYQWEWLQRGLESSTATFKALTTGMIWDDKENTESDDWHTYRHEREAIFDFIRDRRISGCFLIGGDIHVSRALNYGPRVGYDLWQFIVSPMHGRTIPSLDIPHPNLVHHAVEPFVFLKLEVDNRDSPAQLKAIWINRDGRRIFEVQLNSDQMVAGG